MISPPPPLKNKINNKPIYTQARVNNFSTRIRELRAGQSQTEFANALNVKQTTYSSWERGVAQPSHEMLVAISTKHNVSADWLLGLSDDTHRYSSNDEMKKHCEQTIQELRNDVDKHKAIVDHLTFILTSIGRDSTARV